PRLDLARDLRQGGVEPREARVVEHADRGEGARVGAARRHVLRGEPAVEGERRGEAPQTRVERLAEAPSPEIAHRTGSAGTCASRRATAFAVRTPRPKRSMKPGAESWRNASSVP